MIVRPRAQVIHIDGLLPPSLHLAFSDMRAGELDPRITFARASSGTYWDASGVLQTATTDEPRFDHNPVTGESLGLLVEGAATNLFTYSEDFSNAAWTKAACTITTNSAIAPDGALTMDEIVLTDIDGAVYTGFSGITGTVTLSCFIKKNTADTSYLLYGSSSFKATFNPNTGEIVSVVGGAASIEEVADDLYRIKFTPSSTSSSRSYVGATGAAGESVYIWQAQLETGTVATSPIPTVASQVTRAVSIPSMTGSNFSSWYTAAKGTFLVNARAGGGADEFLFSAGEAGVNEIAVYRKNSDNDIYMRVIAASVSQVDVSLGDYPASGDCKVAIAYTATGISGCVNGGTVVASGAITVPTVDALYIGERSDQSGVLNGTEKALTFYPETFAAATLQALTGA